MAHLIRQERKSPVLSRPTLPCISMHYTINLTTGCVFGCRYCYAQGYRRNLGPGKCIFYCNSFDKLKAELPKKRTKPQIIYFSTACEPFAPFPEVQDELYKIMHLLLANSISIYISTKAHIPKKFIEIFSRHSDKIFVQVGITTLDDKIRRVLEPHAAPISSRINNIAELLSVGVFTEARMDPIIPTLTDREESLRPLFHDFSELGLENAVASYLFLRKSNRPSVYQALRDLDCRVDDFYTDRIDNYCGGGSIEVPSRQYREEKYKLMASLANEHGISMKFCSCKNPGLTGNICHPYGQATNEPEDRLELF
ncbi:MAG TPA: radical SAM protein [bacterium]|nr:radical SAM protein [bacterium]